MNRCLNAEPRGGGAFPFIDTKDDKEIREITTDTALDAIVLIDIEWKISYWNPAAETMFG